MIATDEPSQPRAQALAGSAAASALIATAAAAKVVRTAPAAAVGTATLAAKSAAAASILTALGGFLDARRADQRSYLTEHLAETHPSLSVSEATRIVSDEDAREQAYAAKARARVQRDVQEALNILDADQRRDAIRKILEREKRIAIQREDAQTARVAGAAEQRGLEASSPSGALWELGDAREHTPDCVAMAGKVWPHSILRNYHPPLHAGCACKLVADPSQATAPDEALLGAMQTVHEAALDDGDHELAEVLEAVYDERWGSGTTKGGQFRPKRGGVPGRPTRPHMPHVRFTADELIANFRRMHGREPSQRQIAELRRRYPSEATPVKAITEEADVRNLPVRDLAEGDRVMINGQLERVNRVHPGPAGLVELEHSGLSYIDHESIRGIRAGGEPEPKPQLVRPDAPEPQPPNAPETDPVKPPEPTGTTASPVGGVTHEQLMTVARMKRPQEPSELIPGVHYNPDLGRSESRNGEQHLPPGFFKQSRRVREKVLLRHQGGVLADALGDQGIRGLGDDHLTSRKSIVDTYHAINNDALRDRFVALHPGAARTIAQAAHERGLPLHPEAANLAAEPAAEHPAHALAEQLHDQNPASAQDLLAEAGYHYGGDITEPDGSPSTVFHNHDVGASIITNRYSDGAVKHARVDIHAPADPELTERLTSSPAGEVPQIMRDAGFAPNFTSAGEWDRFVHPDGRGIAVHTDPSTGQADRVDAYRPTDDEVTTARRVLIQSDPVAHIKPGDNASGAIRDLERGYNSFDTVGSGTTDDGAHFVTLGRGQQRITIHHQGDTITAIGLAHPDSENHPGRIVSASEHETALAEIRAKVQADRAERERQANAGRDALHEAIANDNASGISDRLVGQNIRSAADALRAEGFDLIKRRQSRRDRTMTYTFRGPNGQTLRVTSGYTFADQTVQKIKWEGNPQAGDRTRLPNGTAPKTLTELLSDALGRADELGEKYGAHVNVTAIMPGGAGRGALAHHEFNGTIALKRGVQTKAISDYLKKRAGGEALNDREHLSFYHHLEVLQHEINHGVGKAGDAPGGNGMAFGPGHYQGLGKTVEEALTEETGHLEVADWLRSYGMHDVLGAVKRNPDDDRVLGTYRDYRVSLRHAMDKGNVPEDERADLIRQMKFQMSPREQRDTIARLAGEPDVQRAMSPTSREEAAHHQQLRRNFQPVARPDLSDIDGAAHVTTGAGRLLTVGDEVTVDTAGGTLTGTIVDMMPSSDPPMVKVLTDDGLTLWYPIERVH